jgi:hypothetical protein
VRNLRIGSKSSYIFMLLSYYMEVISI